MSDKELWRPVVDYEGIYDVSNLGRIRSVSRIVLDKNGKARRMTGKLLRLCDDNRGYLQVCLNLNGKGKSFKVHRLVARSFLGSKDDLTVNHINGIKKDNRASNLEWLTLRQNISHAWRNGLMSSIKKQPRANKNKHHRAKLTENDVLEIVEGLSDGFTQLEIAKHYGVIRTAISSIARGLTWSWVTGIKK